jgi:peptide/nickel transport system ATP-binding protein
VTAALPQAGASRPDGTAPLPVLRVERLVKHFPVRGRGLFAAPGRVHAVDDVSFSIAPGETLALVGESGCGKSTVGRAILRLVPPTSGEVWLGGQRIDALPEAQLRPLRHRMQVVFQDPFSSLNPRLRVRELIGEPLRNLRPDEPRAQRDARVAALLERVRLPADAIGRFAHEFSGGQRQRIGIARALATDPQLVVCDEPVSALDVSVKAQIVNLLADLQAGGTLAMLFVSHDMAIVEHLAHRVAVMYLGRIVEIADRRRLFATPAHPYTEALLSAVPLPEPGARRERIVLAGDVPSPIDPPAGCRFHTRCPRAFERCRVESPPLRRIATGHEVACHLHETGPGPA